MRRRPGWPAGDDATRRAIFATTPVADLIKARSPAPDRPRDDGGGPRLDASEDEPVIPIRDHNPTQQTPFVTYALIAVNVLVFISYAPLLFDADHRGISAFFAVWALQPAEIVRGEDLHTLLTAMFLHGSIMHIVGNMLFLWIFGDNMEEHFGHLGFLLFYLATGVAASALQIVADPTSTVPNVGASGAIAGVMGGYLVMWPKARVDILIILGFFVRMAAVPAFVMLGVWFALQILGGVASAGQQGGGVAYWAHAGGFIAGVALVAAAWIAGRRPARIDGHPAHPEAVYRVPRVPRRG